MLPFLTRLVPPALALLLAAGALAPAQAELLPHRAVYDLTLGSGSRSLDDARGRLVFEFDGNACEGYTTNVRQVATLSGGAGSTTLDIHSTSFEEGDGSALRFRSEVRSDNRTVSRVDGEARIADGAMQLELRRPREATKSVAQTPAFPVGHLKAILAAARDGLPILAMPVFDGADDGEQIYDTLAVVGREAAPEAEPAFPELAESRRWPVTLSYFKQEDGQGEQTPAHVVSFNLHENGVSTDLRLDFGDFVLDGALASLEALPAGECP
jgi:hypothetical protein